MAARGGPYHSPEYRGAGGSRWIRNREERDITVWAPRVALAAIVALAVGLRGWRLGTGPVQRARPGTERGASSRSSPRRAACRSPIGNGAPGLRRVFGEGGQQELVTWIRANGRLVGPAEWRSEPRPIFGRADRRPGRPGECAGAELYDLRPQRSAGN